MSRIVIIRSMAAGRHGSAVDIRVLLEPLLLKFAVAVVFTGHDHVYEDEMRVP